MNDINKEVMNKIADDVTKRFADLTQSNDIQEKTIAAIAEIAAAVVLEYHNEIKRLDE